MRLNEAGQHADDDQDDQEHRQRNALGQGLDSAVAAAFVGHHVEHAGTEVPDDGDQENDDQDLAGRVDIPWRAGKPANRSIIMSAGQGRRWHRPGWLAIVSASFGACLFTWLGFWQLHRATEKEALLAAYAGAAKIAPVMLSQARRVPVGEIYPHVRVRGRYDLQRDYVLDDQVRDGRQGVIVLSPFKPDDGALALLINRGFIVKDEHAQVPVIPELPSAEVELSGLYWPKLTIHIDTTEIGEDLGYRIDSRVILLDADPASGFTREWTPQIIPPERHLGYAVQWFGFLVTTIVIFIVLHWRREKTGSQ